MPSFVKNNSKVIHLVQTFNNHNKLKELETHYKMLDMIFSSCDIKATGVMREIQLLGEQ
jgi:lipopolysaccharide cholinephosphotransferase